MKKELRIDVGALVADEKQSITRQLEEYLPQIESYLAKGVRRKTVLDHLNRLGFDLSMSTFETMLKRIRKRNKARKANGSLPVPIASERHVVRRADGDPYTAGPKKLDHDLGKTTNW